MARKKTNKITDIKTNNNFPVGYKGNITIKFTKKGRVIKTEKYTNKGTFNLFKCIACALCGQFSASNELRPTKLMAQYHVEGNSDKDMFTSKVIYRVPPQVAVSELDNKATATFKFMVSNGQIINGIINRFSIFNGGNGEESLATFDLTTPIEIKQDDTFNLEITWVMTIENK